MKIQQCDREQQVLDALQSGCWAGPWGEELRKHAFGCAVCSEVVLVTAALRHEGDLAQGEVRLPSAGLVWWRAKLAARRAAEERAAQPIALVERVAQALGVLTVLGLGFWQWARILDWLSGTKVLGRFPAIASTESLHRFLQGFAQGLGQSQFYLLVMTAGTFLTLVTVAAYVLWREE